MFRYLPIALGVLAIVGLTIPQIVISDRFQESNISAEQFAEQIKHVPERIGDWVGENLPVEEQVRKTAGVVGRYVNRSYRNSRTGDEVKLWLICGHSKDITGHTPEICYPSSGFSKRAEENSLYPFTYGDGEVADFFTNTFVKEDQYGQSLVRVFWSWFHPKEEGNVQWVAPGNPRTAFGNSRALYKMYFTSTMETIGETTEQSPCVRFARDALPVIKKALERQAGADGSSAADGTEQPAA